MNSRGHDLFRRDAARGPRPGPDQHQRIRGEFERQVVADTPQEIERDVQSLIDWLVRKGPAPVAGHPGIPGSPSSQVQAEPMRES